MRRIKLTFGGALYFLDGITGSLMRREVRDTDNAFDEAILPTHQAEALEQVREPYLLNIRKRTTTPIRIPLTIRLYARMLTWLCRHAFLLGRLWAKIPLKYYLDAGVATEVYYRLYPGEQQRKLCLPRAFFARSTSRRFKNHGTMFVGAFLPSVQMHAWVIEDGMHADVYDDNWINFAPVAIFD